MSEETIRIIPMIFPTGENKKAIIAGSVSYV